MSNELIGKLNEATKSNYESAKELYNINVRTLSQLAEQQVAYSKLCMESMNNTLKNLSSAKDIKDAASAQSELYQSVSDKAQGIARNSLDILNETKEEVSAWVEKNVEDFNAKVKAAA